MQVSMYQPPRALTQGEVASGAVGSSSKALEEPGSVEVLEFTSIADVLITTTKGNAQFLVSSHILRIVSEVWDKSLSPSSPFKKPEPIEFGGKKYLNIESDDDPEALRILFRIIHFQADQIPSEISFSELRSLAVLCDKYDCHKSLNPWHKPWLDHWVKRSLEPGYEDWLFIAKVFKDNRKVNELLELLEMECSSLSVCGNHFQRNGKTVMTTLWPHTQVDQIIARRKEAVDPMTAEFRSLGFPRQPNSIPQYLQEYCQYKPCLYFAYGVWLGSISANNLSKLIEMDWHGSVKDLAQKMANVEYVALKTSQSETVTVTYTPYRCSPINNRHSDCTSTIVDGKTLWHSPNHSGPSRSLTYAKPHSCSLPDMKKELLASFPARLRRIVSNAQETIVPLS